MKFHTAFLGLLLLSLSFIVKCEENIFVQTKSAGRIKGKIVNVDGQSYHVYLGIPYAKPPVGTLSFKAPQPLEPKNTQDTTDASKDFGKRCIDFMYSPETQSEDCLFLNVMSPKNVAGSKYPVMLWIHGGGFVAGSASEYSMEGSLRNIVSRGVVFVSINYRLGVYGFFTTKSSVAPGNYGLLDQVEALKWVQKNIEFFHGDPSKVTIFGESAGGGSVSFLTMSPLAKGLFNQAIMMSGSALGPWALVYDSDPEDISDKLLETVGCRNSSQQTPSAKPQCPYRYNTSPSATNEELAKHQQEVECIRTKFTDIITKAFLYVIKMRPRVDGYFLPQLPEILIKNRPPINILSGATKTEHPTLAFMGVVFQKGLVLSKEMFHQDPIGITCADFKYPKLVDLTVHHHYANPKPSTVVDEKRFWFDQDSKAHSTRSFAVPTYKDAVEALKTNSKVYLYSWDYEEAHEMFSPKDDFYWKGASHASELFYLFNMSGFSFLRRDIEPSRRNKIHDTKASEILGKLWTNFAKFGNPTPDNSMDGVVWNPLSATDANYLSIEVPKIQMKNKFFEEDVELWTHHVPRIEASVVC